MIDIPESVFPKDLQGNTLCPKCQKIVADCQCPGYDPTQPKQNLYSPRVCLDKSNRHGKIVTLITDLPMDEKYLKQLAKHLKSKTGSGGTFYIKEESGVIEIQGDKRDIVLKELQTRGFGSLKK
ncbi:MAG: stress response translation initiation inhibitor YciH [Candidatus Omnitrophica bacterium]|nr:stress response translation initiation inhibitor YciH [Candidatus Omnitrophota bacterium]MCB9747527.1 stress response translation initiation inhibitor YciH [Candidatus Omnitrophota bacterium]